MNAVLRTGIIVLSIAAAAALGVFSLREQERYPSTDDAYVDADIVGIVAQVAGPIVKLAVQDNQPVKAGDLLFEIDPRPFKIAVDQARAQLDSTRQNVSAAADQVASAEAGVQRAKASLQLAESQWKRIQPLAKVGAVPFQDQDKAKAGLDSARSGLANAQAKLTQAQHELGQAGDDNAEIRAAAASLADAELQLGYCRVVSPVNGYVTNLSVSQGSYASAGSPILAIVDADSWRVIAYIKETQLRHLNPGQPTRVYLPSYPKARFEAHVQGIGWGIEQEDNDGATSASGVPSVDPTVDWVRLAQRFPVRIALVDPDPAHPLRKGMRASVRIDATGAGSGG